jgi:endonuclease/exonuclease/phosphatase family metal-dependent hydrolase
MKKIGKLLLKLIVIIIVFFVAFLGYMTISDYQPEEKINLLEGNKNITLDQKDFNILIWNIGYAGLGADMDFFYDGGQQVRTSEANTINNLSNITTFLASQSNIDFYLLQEVDVDAKRTYSINELDSIEKALPNYMSIYADNYLVDFVPVPLSEPMGSVKAGLQILSKHIPQSADRYAFPGNYDWPTSLFMLDRCFIANRYQLKNGKEFILINTHNSAFDDGSLKKQQLDYLKAFLEKELAKGNYFVVGGDWNQNPPEFDHSKYSNYSESKEFKLSSIDKTLFPEDWQFVFDSTTATNRSNIRPYKKGESATTVLDFFLVSPNIKAKFVTAIDLDFQNSDHQPVIMNFKLK